MRAGIAEAARCLGDSSSKPNCFASHPKIRRGSRSLAGGVMFLQLLYSMLYCRRVQRSPHRQTHTVTQIDHMVDSHPLRFRAGQALPGPSHNYITRAGNSQPAHCRTKHKGVLKRIRGLQDQQTVFAENLSHGERTPPSPCYKSRLMAKTLKTKKGNN